MGRGVLLAGSVWKPLFVTIVCVLLMPLIGNSQEPTFRAIGLEQGMPSASVTDVLQDQHGLMWFATPQGLASYNGQTVTAYTAEPGNPAGLQNASIDRLAEDAYGQLWLTTDDGLVRFSRQTETFTTYRFSDSNAANTRKANRLRPLAMDKQGHIWVGSEYGLRLFDPAAEQEIATFYNAGKEGFTREDVYALFVDSKGNVWAGGIGLRVYNRQRKEILRYKPFPTRNDSYNLFRAFYEAPDGTIWAAGDFGLIRFDNLQQPTIISEAQGVPNRFLWTFAPDLSAATDGNPRFWMANYGVGLVQFDPVQQSFKTFKPNPNNPNALPVRFVVTTYRDRQGGLWVGTEGAGALYQKPVPRYSRWQQFASDQRAGKNAVTALLRKDVASWYVGTPTGIGLLRNPGKQNASFQWIDSTWKCAALAQYKGELVAANFSKGVRFYTSDGQLLRTVDVLGGEPVHNVHKLAAGADNSLWVGTVGEGLTVYRGSETAAQNFFPRDTLASYLASTATALYRDQQQHLWANVPREGTYRFSPQGSIVSTLQQGALSSNTVNCILQDHRGRMWFGHAGAGLDVHDLKTGTTQNFTRANGLPGTEIVALLEDAGHRLWVATNLGVAVLQPDSARFRDVSVLLDLPVGASEVVQLALAANGDVLAVGGMGLLRFNPATLLQPVAAPTVQVQAVQVAGKLQPNGPATGSALQLTLPNTAADWMVQTSLVAVQFPGHATAHWKLPPFTTTWQSMPANGQLYVPNLPPGNYTLHLQTGYTWGDMQQIPNVLTLVVPTPWWRSGWAIVAVLLGLLVLFWGVVQLRTRMLVRQTKRLENLVSQRTSELEEDRKTIAEQAEQLRNLDKQKNRFFANISHELRTPLTLILGPLESFFAESSLSPRQQRFFEVIKTNGRKLQQLVEEILDLSKLDASQLKLNLEPVPLHSTINRLLFSFESVAYRRNLELVLHYELPEQTWYQLDLNRIEKIATNLLSNAVKFTERGSVTVWVRKATSVPETLHAPAYIELAVADTGPGIHPNDLPHIFERYFQSAQPETPMQGGTGIGLALARELARLHKGQLIAESELGKGSTFTLLLPLVEAEPPTLPEEVEVQAETELLLPEQLHQQNGPVVLVAEDHPEMSTYITELLAPVCTVVQVDSGRKALEYLRKHRVDLLTSDVMMPEMDGFELLAQVKADENLRTLPVLMLTARADEKDKLQALTLGVDDYLVKPFVAAELIARVNNLLANRAVREAASLPETGEEPVHTEASVDQKLVQRLRETALQHLHESDYTIAMLAPELGLSERQLFREIKRITGLTPGKLLRELRLQQARGMLERKEAATVAEICYAVGFEKPGYFSKVFNERFGRLPSSYL